MKPDIASELANIRETQADLVAKLQAVDRRIRELEGRVAEPDVMSPQIPGVVVPIPAPAAPQPPAVSLPPAPVAAVTVEKTSAPAVPPPLPVFREPPPSSAPPKTAAPSVPRDSFEMRLGRVWLVRVGIVLVLTGLVFLGNFAWQEMVTRLGPGGKLALIYLAGAALAVAGWVARRRSPQLRQWGNVLAGGGLAVIYYATYAAHFVTPLRIIGSPLVGGALLVLLAGAIIVMAVRLKLEVIASITTALAFYTAAINPVAGFSLFSNLLLSAVAVVLLVRQRWISVSFISLAGCYLCFAFWRFHQTGTLLAVSVESAEIFRAALLFPACYWAVFTSATFLGRAGPLGGTPRVVFLTLNNAAFYGLTAPLFAGTYPDQLWLFTLLFGGVLLGLARGARRREAGEFLFDGSYLAQGLAMVCLGLFLKFSGYEAALVFALQSATLMKLSRVRNGAVFQFFSGLSAVLAACFSLEAVLAGTPRAALTAGGVALALAGTAWLFTHQRQVLSPPTLRWRASAFIALAALVALAGIFHGTNDGLTLALLLLLAVLGSYSLRMLQMPEFVYAAQGFALAALLQWGLMDDFAAMRPAVGLGAALLLLLHWWQRQGGMTVAGWLRLFWQAAWALALVVVLLVWTMHRVEMPGQLLALAALGLALLTYAVRTKSLPLLVAGQILSLATVLRFAGLVGEPGQFGLCVAAVALFLLQSPVAGRWQLGPQVWIMFGRRAIEFVATLGVILIVREHIPLPWICLTLAVSAFLCFGGAVAARSWAALLPAGLLFLAAASEFVRGFIFGAPAFGPDFLAPLLLLASQQLGRWRLRGLACYPRWLEVGSIIAGVLGFWFLLWKLVAESTQGFLITISWSVLGSLVLAAGFALRERSYRLLGLVILAASVGRIFLVDVWQLDTIYRILSFLVLGVLLLAAGFVYNRFAGVLRKWI